MISIADQAEMLNMVGINVTLETSPGVTTVIRADYRPENSVVNGIITDKPTLRMVGNQLAGMEYRDLTVTVDAVDYRLLRPLPDAAGFMIVGLVRI